MIFRRKVQEQLLGGEFRTLWGSESVGSESVLSQPLDSAVCSFFKKIFFFLIYLLGCAKLSLQHASSLVADGNS